MFFSYPPDWKFAVNSKTSINVDVRCQGGFAVLPPTTHASGDALRLGRRLRAVGRFEKSVARPRLAARGEVERLVREHGHVFHGKQMARIGQPWPALAKKTGQYDAFGHQTDGRETFMRDLVWGAVVDWHRECPIKPSGGLESRHKASREIRNL